MVYLQILLNQLIIIPIYIVPIIVKYCITLSQEIWQNKKKVLRWTRKKKNA